MSARTVQSRSAGAGAHRELRLVADAVDGDRQALEWLGATHPGAARAMEAALAFAARSIGLSVPLAWRRALRECTANWLLIEPTYDRAAAALEPLAWTAIKGYDTAHRYYRAREQRPAKDLDLLVHEHEAERAIGLLEHAGWRGLYPGRRAQRYLFEEGYCWQAIGPGGALLELHIRLWPLLPAELAAEVITGSEHSQAHRGPRACHAYILAAVHYWLQERPRRMVDLFDLEHIVRATDDLAALAVEIVDCARRHQIQLPLALTADLCNQIWPDDLHADLVSALLPELSRSERWLLSRAGRAGPDAVGSDWVQASRWLAGRPSRRRPAGALRRVWPHPGVVERETPGAWTWPRRRFVHLLRGRPPARRASRPMSLDRAIDPRTTSHRGGTRP